ncbi:MAG: type pilus assembly PilZ [Deltaproteobacteria bacterium]|nr:type pilus assembly PilZ [Deltaproteobacteria bacterium]
MTLHVAGHTHAGRTTNVSRGGLCVDLVDPLAHGADLEIDIQLVFDDETQSEPLRLPARVAWCTTVDDAFQVGLMFRPLSAEIAGYLTMFLRFLQDGQKPTRSKRESNLDKRFD